MKRKRVESVGAALTAAGSLPEAGGLERRSAGENPHSWRLLNAMSNSVHGLRAAEVKDIMAVIRTAYLAGDTDVASLYFPRHGLTAGEFATLYVLNMPGKPSKKRSALQQVQQVQQGS